MRVVTGWGWGDVMAKTPKLFERVAYLRDLAKRARRLAAGLSPADRDRLMRYGEQLDKEASELDRQAAGLDAPPRSAPAVSRTVMQMQQQQQRDASTPEDAGPEGPEFKN
jgi:hypothetical protein